MYVYICICCSIIFIFCHQRIKLKNCFLFLDNPKTYRPRNFISVCCPVQNRMPENGCYFDGRPVGNLLLWYLDVCDIIVPWCGIILTSWYGNNWPHSQIPQCTCSISRNASFYNRNGHISFTKWCIVTIFVYIVWLVRWVYSRITVPLSRELIGHRWIPPHKWTIIWALMCVFIVRLNELLHKQSNACLCNWRICLSFTHKSWVSEFCFIANYMWMRWGHSTCLSRTKWWGSCAYVMWNLRIAWWRHDMENFSALLVLCKNNPPVNGSVTMV